MNKDVFTFPMLIFFYSTISQIVLQLSLLSGFVFNKLRMIYCKSAPYLALTNSDSFLISNSLYISPLLNFHVKNL